MKNLIFLPVLFFLLENFLISHASSQQLQPYGLTSYREQTNNHGNQSATLMRFTPLISSSHADTTKKEKPKSWWETLLDFDFWQKLSGPGPFLGVGIKYPVFKPNKVFAVFIGASFSNSLDNRLRYTDYKTVIDSSFGNIIYRSHDSCVQCNESKAVQMVSLKADVQYHIPGSKFDLFLGGGLHTFFGEAFKSFSRISGTFGAGWRPPLQCLRVGLMVNIFEHFRPSKFGAVDGSDSTGSVEFVPGAFISVSLH